jgi:hypothetical protein
MGDRQRQTDRQTRKSQSHTVQKRAGHHSFLFKYFGMQDQKDIASFKRKARRGILLACFLPEKNSTK